MTGVLLVEVWPLALLAAGPDGPAKLLRMLGWHSPYIPPVGWLAASLVTVAYVVLSMSSLPFIRHHALSLSPTKALTVPFSLVTGTFEELFFRKYLMDTAAAQGSTVVVQVILSGLVFGAAHAIWGLFGGSLVAAGKAMLFTTGLGLALAVVYLLSARQLAPAAWSHIAINLIIEPWLMLAVINLRSPRPSS